MMKKISLNSWILFGAMSGVALGLWMAEQKDASATHAGIYLAGLVGGVFIDLLKMVMVPLVFTSIVVGIANLRAHHQIHPVGPRLFEPEHPDRPGCDRREIFRHERERLCRARNRGSLLRIRRAHVDQSV